MAGNKQDCIFKVGDVVACISTKERHKVTSVEYYEPYKCWYIGIDGEEEAEHGEDEFLLVEIKGVQPDQMSTEELISLIEEAEKLLKEKQEASQAEIKNWITDLASCGHIVASDLECELFVNTEFVIDMLQRYLDNKGK